MLKMHIYVLMSMKLGGMACERCNLIRLAERAFTVFEIRESDVVEVERMIITPAWPNMGPTMHSVHGASAFKLRGDGGVCERLLEGAPYVVAKKLLSMHMSAYVIDYS